MGLKMHLCCACAVLGCAVCLWCARAKGLHVLEVAVETSSLDMSASERILDSLKSIQRSLKDKKRQLDKEAALSQGAPPAPAPSVHQGPSPSGSSAKEPPQLPQKV